VAAVFVRLLNLLFSLYSLAIVLRAFLPWLGVGIHHPLMRVLISITEPLLTPLRRHIPLVGNMDFTPLVALALLWLLELLLQAMISALF